MQVTYTLDLSDDAETPTLKVGDRDRVCVQISVADATTAAGAFHVRSSVAAGGRQDRDPVHTAPKTAGNGLNARHDIDDFVGYEVSVEYAYASGGVGETAEVLIQIID